MISQAFSGIACVIYSKRKFEILHTDEEERKVNKGYMKTLCGMGVPMGLQYSITAIGSVILQSAVNTLGSNAVASMTAETTSVCSSAARMMRSVLQWQPTADRTWERRS